jgi:hypothetical protein
VHFFVSGIVPIFLKTKFMRKILTVVAIFTSALCHVQSKVPFGKMPEFLVNASQNEMIGAFQSQIFASFSATLPEGVVIAYENTTRAKEGSLNEIKNQISMFKNRLIAAKDEVPSVKFFKWADYTERSEVYPCGLVVIFRDELVTHVWLDLK